MLRDLITALADNLRTSLAGNDLDIQVEPRLIVSPSTPVSVSVTPANPPRESSLAGMGDLGGAYVLEVLARANVADNDATQDILVDMIDDQHALSIAAAVDADQTLGGWSTFVYVDPDRCTGLQLFPVPDGPPFVGCSWTVLVGQAES